MRVRSPGDRGLDWRGAVRFLPALAWAAALFALSSRPKLPALPIAVPGLDKLQHAVAFGALAWLLAYGARFPRGAKLWLCAVAATVYGVSDELHQAFVPGREPDAWDVLADACGAFLICALIARRGSAAGDGRHP